MSPESPIAEPPRLLNLVEEARLYRWLHRSILKTTLRELLATSRLRASLAAFMSMVIWVALFFIMLEGFFFLQKEAGAFTQETVEKVFNIFYASLMIMLFFSSAILLYGGIYQSQEVRFLMTTPTSPERIFQYKFSEAVFLSGWGFILIGSPMLVAYGIVVGANWYYYVLLLPLMIAFAFIPTGLGAIVCLATVHFFAPLRRPIVVVSALTVFGLVAWSVWTVFFSRQNELLTPEWFEETMIRLSTAENRLFPSWWLCSGILEAARSESGRLEYQSWAQAILFFALLASNALFLQMIASLLAGRILFVSYNRLQTAVRHRRTIGFRWLDQWMTKILSSSPTAIRLLLIKDFRLVRRDPLQWAQFLIFFGLVGLYFLNIKSIQDAAPFAGWVNLVSFLNLLVVGLILSTFTTRFIFPMISLEGQKFWILGLLPIERETILRGKFLFASIGTFLPSSLLILLSDSLLQLPGTIVAVHELVCLLLCAGLAAIAVGLGASIPNLRAISPSKIASGFGGTLNLVLSAVYIIFIVGVAAGPCHLDALVGLGHLSEFFSAEKTQMAMLIGILIAVAVGIWTVYFMLRIGFRAFRQMEF
ncbi:MAG: hypothetical protein VX431_03335 [Planctomycetota bacterium]|nr:hypothetical protein [Planctomycetota bacterium]